MTYHTQNPEALAKAIEEKLRSRPGYSFNPDAIRERIAEGIEVGHEFRGARYEGGNTWAKLNADGDVVETQTFDDAVATQLGDMALEKAATGAANTFSKRGS